MPKKKKPEKGLSIRENKGELTTAQMMAHPVIREMTARIETMSALLSNLPRLIGEAVAASQNIPSGRAHDIVPGQIVRVRGIRPPSEQPRKIGRKVADGVE